MDLMPYVETLRRELAVAAERGGEEARALAERLIAPLDSAIRLMLLDVLSSAADEITRELAPGSVELRLRAGDPEFVVTPAAGRRSGRAGDRHARRRLRLRRPTTARSRASTCACPSNSRPASSRPRAASGCRSTPGSSAPPPPRSRPTLPTAARRSAAAGSARRYTGWVR